MTEKKATVKRSAGDSTKESKILKTSKPENGTPAKRKPSIVNSHKQKLFNKQQDDKPVDWNEFKKKKKELRMKRRESRNVDDIRDVLPKVKQLDEKIRIKTLRGGKEEREKLIMEIHSLLNKRNVYSKLVLAHDTARIVQHILKYGSASVRKEVSKVSLV